MGSTRHQNHYIVILADHFLHSCSTHTPSQWLVCLTCTQATKTIYMLKLTLDILIIQYYKSYSSTVGGEMLLGILTPRLSSAKKPSVSPLGPPAGSFSLPPLDARGWCDHENGRGRASRSQQRKEAIVALTRPSASESGRKRLS